MKQLILASAIGVFAFAAQAHGDATQSAATTKDAKAAEARTSKMTGDDTSQAESRYRYEAAQAACEQQNAEARADCRRHAVAERQNGTNGTAANGTTSSSVPAAALPSAPASLDATQADATSPSSTHLSGNASAAASISDGMETAGSGQTSDDARGD